ncbi:hypothetical protein KCU64_g2351, partial [Aureobasidium melanogenum]
MRFSLTFPALAANMAAVLAAPQPQDLNINMIVAAPDPTYSEAVGVTAQVVTLDSTAIAAQATSAVSSASIAGAIYQAVKDMSYYPASLTSTFQPFCSSILGYSAGSTTVTTATVTPISYTTVTNVIYQRAASTNPTPAVLTKYPATVVSSACSSVVTSPTATPFVTSTATFSASAVVSTIVTSSTYVIPACSGPSEACAPFVGCGSGTYCECLQRMRGRSAACIDPNQSPGSSCNSDSDCAPGSICFSSCVGNTCQTFQDPNSGICINGNSAKYLFRRGPEARKAAIVPVVDNIKRGLDCNTGKFYCEEV